MDSYKSSNLLSPTTFGILLFPVIAIALFIGRSNGFIVLSIILLYTAISFLSARGVDIDINKGRVRFYKSIVGIKFGSWRSANEFPFFNIRAIHKAGRVMPNIVMDVSVHARDTAVYLYDKVNKEEITLCSAQNYDLHEVRDLLLELGVQQKFRKKAA